MVIQRDVLGAIAERTAAGRLVDVGHVSDRFGLSSEAAAGHLWRLWRERLVEPPAPRRPRFRFRLEPGESMAALCFRITHRGRRRLRWYEQQPDDGGWQIFR